VVTGRAGRSTLGCLFTLLLVVAAGYFALNVGEPYMRFYRFKDAMRQELRFASNRTDADITRRLAAFADSIGLPPEAGAGVKVKREGRSISIWSEYAEHVELPLVARDISFAPLVEGQP
jgi:hypothetical protein